MAAAEIAKSKIDAFAELGMAQTVKAVCEEIRRLYQWDQVPWVKQTSRMNARSRLSRSRCSKRRRGNSWQSSVGSCQKGGRLGVSRVEFSFEYDGVVGRARDRVSEWVSDRAAERVLWLSRSVAQLSGSRQADVGVLGSAAGVGWTFLSDGDSTGRNAHRTWGMTRRAHATPLARLGKGTGDIT